MAEKLLTIGLKSSLITRENTVMNCLKKALQAEKLLEKDIIIITSKVVAIDQGRTAKISSKEDFDLIVKEEADKVLGGEQVTLTQKNNIFTPWAGIDTSNAPNGEVILWPKDSHKAAFNYLSELKKTYKLKQLGLVISDSICAPLRNGVTAIALGYAGFKGVNDIRGQKDLFGKSLKVSQQNMADMLATTANLVMGEAAEQTPFAIVRGANVEFTNEQPDPNEATIPQNKCLFGPLYKV